LKSSTYLRTTGRIDNETNDLTGETVGVSVLALLGEVVGKGGGMKRLVLSVAVVGMTLALAAGMALAQATTDTFHDQVPFTSEMINPCTGGVVLFEGTTHFVFHRTADAGGGFHFKGHNNIQVKGVSDSGAKYVLLDVGNVENFDVFSESADNFTLMGTSQVIRQGSETAEDDFQAKLLFHVTINANGEITSEVEQIESECK
jgi:hypothetical protein